MPVTKNPDGTFRFIQPDSNVTVTPTFEPIPEPGPNPDPNQGGYTTENPAPPEVTGVSNWLVTDTHTAYISGFGDGTFRPNANITRAQAAMMFYRLLKDQNVPRTTSFTDMTGSEWYAEAVYALSSLGIIQGYSDGTFRGNDTISRAAFTAIAARFGKADGETAGPAIQFSDVTDAHWAKDVIATASGYGWIGGYADGTFQPSAPIARAAVTAIINRMRARSADETYVRDHYAELNLFSDVTDTGAWYFYNVMEAANAHGYSVTDGKEIWNG